MPLWVNVESPITAIAGHIPASAAPFAIVMRRWPHVHAAGDRLEWRQGSKCVATNVTKDANHRIRQPLHSKRCTHHDDCIPDKSAGGRLTTSTMVSNGMLFFLSESLAYAVGSKFSVQVPGESRPQTL